MSRQQQRKPHVFIPRKHMRLQGYDYSSPGYYYVTICTQDSKCWFGRIIDGEMRLNRAGNLVKDSWMALPGLFPGLELDAFVIMPNHMHGLLLLNENVRRRHQKHGAARPKVGRMISAFKGRASYYLHKEVSRSFRWERDFYDSIIRSQKVLDYVQEYIFNNPVRWAQDRLYRDDSEE